MDIIDRWLKVEEDNSKKQRHRVRRIYHHRLYREHGFQGSKHAVRRYVHDARNRLGFDAGAMYLSRWILSLVLRGKRTMPFRGPKHKGGS
jgi:hypothetical protein